MISYSSHERVWQYIMLICLFNIIHKGPVWIHAFIPGKQESHLQLTEDQNQIKQVDWGVASALLDWNPAATPVLCE